MTDTTLAHAGDGAAVVTSNATHRARCADERRFFLHAGVLAAARSGASNHDEVHGDRPRDVGELHGRCEQGAETGPTCAVREPIRGAEAHRIGTVL